MNMKWVGKSIKRLKRSWTTTDTECALFIVAFIVFIFGGSIIGALLH